jgi:hypothetical protein
MMIRKPIGAKLPCCELPGGSFVNTVVIEAPDGLPDLRLTHPAGKPLDVSISDLNAIFTWAERP